MRIKTKGRILEGKYKNWHIFIQDDTENTGGYLILLSSPNESEGYDDWVENWQSLEGYFREANWKIQWLEDESHSS